MERLTNKQKNCGYNDKSIMTLEMCEDTLRDLKRSGEGERQTRVVGMVWTTVR